MDINSFFKKILCYFETQLHFLFIKKFCGLFEYIKFVNCVLKNIDSDRRDTLASLMFFTLMLSEAFLSQVCCLYALQQQASIHNINVAVFLECKCQIS